MRKIVLIIAISLLIASLGYAQDNKEWTPFKKIEQENGVIKLQFPSQGVRWLFFVNEGPRQLSQYGDVIKLRIGDKLTLIDKHATVIVKPEQKDKECLLLIDYTVDERSFGGKLETKTYYVPIKNNESIQTQPLQLSIKLDKQVYEVGEEIKLEAAIKNNSGKEMILFWNNANPSFRQEEIGVVTAYLSTFPVEDAETIRIKPESVIVKHISINNTLKPLSFKYRLIFQYDICSVPVDFLLSLNQRVFTGTLTSNTITIEVREKKCASGKECVSMDCSKYGTPGVKEGYKSDCVEGKCECMCYGCK